MKRRWRWRRAWPAAVCVPLMVDALARDPQHWATYLLAIIAWLGLAYERVLPADQIIYGYPVEIEPYEPDADEVAFEKNRCANTPDMFAPSPSKEENNG